jgi:pyridoxal phosphate enzyme (YggS family)
VQLVVVAKGRQAAEVMEAVDAGAEIIGENYVQDTAPAQSRVGCRAKWHFIGHLQKNKIKKALSIFDVVQTVDSLPLAVELARRSAEIGHVTPVFLEVNSGREPAKSGLFPEKVEETAAGISLLPHLKVMGLMTMGPVVDKPALIRPYFAETRRLFESIARAHVPNVDMKYLSMGMSDSYKEAIAEGANMVRLGRAIFGERPV